MDFETKVDIWKNEGAEPDAERKEKGFEGGYYPPAGTFNWFWHLITKGIKELQDKLTSLSAEDIGKGVLPVERGGTGETDLNDVFVGKASWAEYANWHAMHDCSNKDFNTLKNPGTYFGYTGMTNAAFNEIGVLEVIPYSNDWLLQRHTRLSDGQTWCRYFRGGTSWSEWYIVHTDKHGSSAKIQKGSYVGTDKNGSGTKNTLTFNFVPKMVIVSGGTTVLVMLNGCNTAQPLPIDVTGTSANSVSWDNKTISWYSGYSPSYQCNSNQTYHYIAIG